MEKAKWIGHCNSQLSTLHSISCLSLSFPAFFSQITCPFKIHHLFCFQLFHSRSFGLFSTKTFHSMVFRFSTLFIPTTISLLFNRFKVWKNCKILDSFHDSHFSLLFSNMVNNVEASIILRGSEVGSSCTNKDLWRSQEREWREKLKQRRSLGQALKRVLGGSFFKEKLEHAGTTDERVELQILHSTIVKAAVEKQELLRLQIQICDGETLLQAHHVIFSFMQSLQ